MEYNLKFVIDAYIPWLIMIKKRVNVNRRNRDELKEGYTDTVYSWSIIQYVSEYTGEEFEHGMGPYQIAGELDADGVLNVLNTNYYFDFDYKPREKDILTIRFHYRNREITGIACPDLPYRYILLYYNGKEWERGWRFEEVYKEVYRGILYISPK